MSILIVEDNPVSVKVLDLNLRKQGYQTIMAKSAPEALEILAENTDINLILSDIMMPGMNGLQLLEKVKANPMTRDIPIIMCTALADVDIVKHAVALGCKYYVVKPLNIGQVLAKVREALREVKPVLVPKRRIMSQYNLDQTAYDEIVTTFLKLLGEKIQYLNERIENDFSFEIYNNILELSESAVLIGAERVTENISKMQEAKKDGDKELLRTECKHLVHELIILKNELKKTQEQI